MSWFALSVGCGGVEIGVDVTNDPPTAEIVEPEDGAVLPEGMNLIRGVVGDEGAGWSISATWRLNGEPIEGCADLPVSEDSGGSTECEVALWTYGENTLTLTAFDGELSTEALRTVTVEDTGGPTVAFVGLAARYYADRPSELAATVTDPSDERATLLAHLELLVDGNVVSDADVREGTGPDDVLVYADLPAGERVQLTLRTRDDNPLRPWAEANATVEVLSENAQPTCSIGTDGGELLFERGEDVTLVGTALDADEPESALQVALLDPTGASHPLAVGGKGDWTYAIKDVESGVHGYQLSVVDEVGATCTAELDLVVGVRPELEGFSPAAADCLGEDEVLTLSATATDQDDLARTLSVTLTSDKDGLLIDGENPGSDGSISDARTLSPGHHELTWTVTDPLGLDNRYHRSLDVNGLPTVPQISLDPASPQTGDDIGIVFLAESEDDADAVSYSYAWTRTASAQVVSTSPTLDAQETGPRGEAWELLVTPSDGCGEAPSRSARIEFSIENSAPAVGSVELSPDPSWGDEALACNALDVSDADEDGITLSYRWTVSGVLAGGDDDTLATEHFSPGDEVTCRVTPQDEAGLSGAAVSASLVVEENVVPAIASLAIDPAAPTSADDLHAVATVDDPDGPDTAVDHVWQVGGLTYTGETLSRDTFGKGSVVTLTSTPHDGVATGPSVSVSVSIGNAPPSFTTLVLVPDDPTTDALLSAVPSGWWDIDDHDPESYRYAWFVAESLGEVPVPVHGEDEPQLSGDHFVRGNVVTVRVTPDDGTSLGDPLEASVTIDNSRPSLESASLWPTELLVDSELRVEPSGYADADGDPAQYEVAWTVAGVTTVGGLTYLGALAKGDHVGAVVTPNDGIEDGDPVDAGSLLVGNTPPSSEGIGFSPESPTCATGVTALGTAYIDRDGDPEGWLFEWSNGAQTQTLPPGEHTYGDTLNVTVWPWDGTDVGVPVTGVVAFSNAPPSIGVVEISPGEPKTAQSLTAVALDVEDCDGQTVDLSFEWFSETRGFLGEGQTLAGGGTKGERIYVEATPHDGVDPGDTAASTVVTVGNSPPSITSVLFDPASPNTATPLVAIPVGFSDPDGEDDGMGFEFAWWMGDTGLDEASDTLSDAEFEKGDVVTVQVTPLDGDGARGAAIPGVVTIGNWTPTIEAVEIDPDPLTLQGALPTAVVVGRDERDLDDPVLDEVVWRVDGADVHEGPVLPREQLRVGAAISVCVTPRDGETSGPRVCSTERPVVNLVPSLSDITATENPTEETDLTVEVHGWSDGDGDPERVRIAFIHGETTLQEGLETTLSHDLYAKGDVIDIVATPYDDYDEGTPVTLSRTIGNTPPVSVSVALSPSAPMRWSNVVAVDQVATDADEADVAAGLTYVYSWSVDGFTDPTETSQTFVGGQVSRGQVVEVRVRAYDGTDESENEAVASATVVNSPPSLQEVRVDPESWSTGTYVNVRAMDLVDADDDGITTRGELVDVETGAIVASGPDFEGFVVAGIPVGHHGVVCVTPNDGFEDGVEVCSAPIRVDNTAPTLEIAETTHGTVEDVASTALAVVVGDVDGGVDALVLAGTSSDPSVVPDSGITFGGSGANRTVTVKPAENATTSTPVTITVTVSDGTDTAMDSFAFSVTPVNDPPTLSDVADQTIPEDGTTAGLTFEIEDVEGGLSGCSGVTVTSSDTALTPLTRITVGGTAPTCTLTIRPVADASGTSTISLAVSDGEYTATDSFLLTVTAVNDAPTISNIANPPAFDEDGDTGWIAFTVGDIDSSVSALTLTGGSTNTTLVPTNRISFGGSGANRQVLVRPAANKYGTATITVTVSDGTNTRSDTFTVTVRSVNDPPTISSVADLPPTDEDQRSNTVTFFVNDVETALTSLVLTGSSSNPALIPDTGIEFITSTVNPSERKVRVRPAAEQSGTATITITVSDGSLTASDTTVATVNAVNDPPTIDISTTTTSTNEDTSLTIAFTVADVDNNADLLTLTGTSGNTTVVPSTNLTFGGVGGSRTVTVRPASNQSTSTAFNITVAVSDGLLSSSDAFSMTVLAVDDPPTISAIADRTIAEDGDTGTITFTVGDVDSTISPTLAKASSNPALVPTSSITLGGSGTNRTVRVVPLTNQNGTATITVSVTNGGLTTSEEFTVTVTPVDDPPTLYIAATAASTDEDTSKTLSFTVGDVDTALDALVLTGASGNQTVVPDSNISFGGSGASRTVTVLPAPNESSTSAVRITVRVTDGTTPATDFFDLTVASVNDPPTISDIADRAIDEDANTGWVAFTVGDLETGASSLVVSGSSSNPSVVPNTGISFGGSGASRTVRVTSSTNANGSATITITVRDGNSATASDSFVLTVNPVNDRPTISSIFDQTINEDGATASISFTVGDVESGAGPLTLAGTSSNQALVPDGNIELGGSGGTRTVKVTPLPNAFGDADITVTVSDGVATSSDVFHVTVQSVNDPPTITITETAHATARNTPSTPLTVQIGDVETAVGSLTLSGTSNNTTLVANSGITFGGSGANRTVTVTPNPDVDTYLVAPVTITVGVRDGAGTYAYDSFSFTITCDTGPIDVPSEYGTIGEAVDVACKGAEIRLAAGTYPGPVDLTPRDVVLTGVAGASSTTLQGDGTASVVRMKGSTLQGLTIQGGGGSNGAGIYIQQAAAFVVRNSVVRDNSASVSGGGIYCGAGTNGVAPLIEGTTLSGNSAPTGGGVWTSHGKWTVRDTTLLNNTARNSDFSFNGGGGWSSRTVSVDLDFDRVTFQQNYAKWGAGMQVEGLGSTTANVDLVDVDFLSNAATSYGGGLYLASAGNVSVASSLFDGNSAVFGAASHLSNIGDLQVTSTTFSGNDLNSSIDAVVTLSNVDGVFRGVDFLENTTTGGYAALYFTNPYSSSTAYSSLVLDDVRLLDNIGGPPVFAAGQLELLNVEVVGNTWSANRPALQLDLDGYLRALEVENLVVAGNSGGVSLNERNTGGSMVVTNATITGNARGDGLSVWKDTSPTLAVARISNTIVTDHAGYGIAFPGPHDPALEYNDVFGNSGGRYSGVADPTGSNGNVSVDPSFVDDTSTDPLLWDLHLATTSPLVDAGDPSILDADGSRSDIGAYGGPSGAW